jgi:hypothetical protein
MGWTVRGSNPGGGEIFRSRLDRPWGPPSLLYNGYRVSFPGVKRPNRGVDHPPSSSAEVKERVELYLYSPSGPSWPVIGRTLPFLIIIQSHNSELQSFVLSWSLLMKTTQKQDPSVSPTRKKRICMNVTWNFRLFTSVSVTVCSDLHNDLNLHPEMTRTIHKTFYMSI